MQRTPLLSILPALLLSIGAHAATPGTTQSATSTRYGRNGMRRSAPVTTVVSALMINEPTVADFIQRGDECGPAARSGMPALGRSVARSRTELISDTRTGLRRDGPGRCD